MDRPLPLTETWMTKKFIEYLGVNLILIAYRYSINNVWSSSYVPWCLEEISPCYAHLVWFCQHYSCSFPEEQASSNHLELKTFSWTHLVATDKYNNNDDDMIKIYSDYQYPNSPKTSMPGMD